MKLVLIAEDEAALLDVFSSVVRDLGHNVVVAHDGAEALSLARANRPDLIITDYMMPRLSGLGLLRAVRADPEFNGVPVVIVSAAKPAGVEDADAYLAKPVGLKRFEQTIEACLRAGAAAEREPPHVPNAALTPDQSSALSLAKTEMFSWVAHEIKTPLSSAKMNMQLMLRSRTVAEDAGQMKKGESILRQLDRMDALVNSVLEAARLADGRVMLRSKREDINALLHQIIAYWRDIKPEIAITLELPEETLEADVDAERIRQVIDNLISNAAKYGHPADRIDVKAESSPGRIAVRVRDYGEGIDAAELPKIFERFHRAEGATGQGHGLGLYIASALARLHGGTLAAKSERGEGTTFSLTLPNRSL